MKVLDILRLLDQAIDPGRMKIHLAGWNGEEEPLDVYLRGDFDAWQARQSRRNFECDFVLSLISMRCAGQWLFAGVHDASGYEEVGGNWPYRYRLSERPKTRALNGRLIASFTRPGRQSYLNAERWAAEILVHEIRAERLAIADFPGYRNVALTHADLQAIVHQGLETWRTALSAVAGVYLISDTKSGRLYVGSASGMAGVWGRWSEYAANGHGGNSELQQLLRDAGPGGEQAFRYSILEIADLHSSQEDVLAREAHWKTILMAREHGLNAN